jgi:hypothetical protein
MVAWAVSAALATMTTEAMLVRAADLVEVPCPEAVPRWEAVLRAGQGMARVPPVVRPPNPAAAVGVRWLRVVRAASPVVVRWGACPVAPGCPVVWACLVFPAHLEFPARLAFPVSPEDPACLVAHNPR